MAYSNFTLAKVKAEFQLKLNEKLNLFEHTSKVKPTEFLATALGEFIPLATAIDTEKARSEFIIAQILSEVRRQVNYRISLFSGSEFNVDSAKGLTGYCDFILSCSEEQLEITAPITIIVEAKKENLIGGLGQCIAGMVAAQIFNERANNSIPKIYGTVTSGTAWRFLTLEANTVCIDSMEYYINDVEKILGILLEPIQSALRVRFIQT